MSELNHFGVRPAVLAVYHWIVIQGFLNSTFCVHRLKFSPIKNTKIISFLFTNQCTSDCTKNNIKIYIKTSPTCFSPVTPSSGSALSVLARVMLVEIVNYGASVCD
jgi:hypothetical protein